MTLNHATKRAVHNTVALIGLFVMLVILSILVIDALPPAEARTTITCLTKPTPTPCKPAPDRLIGPAGGIFGPYQ